MITSTGTVKIVEQCGKFQRIARPGFGWLVPCLQGVSGTLSMRLQQMEVACEVKSKDNVFLTMRVAIQYQIISQDEMIYNAHYRLTNPRAQVCRRRARARSLSFSFGGPSQRGRRPIRSLVSPRCPPTSLSLSLADRVVRVRRRPLLRPQD